MSYIVTFSCRVGDQLIRWRNVFAFREEAAEWLSVEHEGIKRHFGEENIKEFKGTVRKVKD